MEARFDGQPRHCGFSNMEFGAVGEKGLEWDLNDWRWDGDLFIAERLNTVPADSVGRQFFPLGAGISSHGNSTNSSSSDEMNLVSEKDQRGLERKRRVTIVEDDNLKGDGGHLSLNVGSGEGSGVKKTKLGAGASNLVICQVENCGAVLSNAKDYHRRHKVCEVHSKASKAFVGGVMQRFCQQCSRFHILQEFDEGKRSCRRRLAGHNRRRRKANPDAGGNVDMLNDNQTSSYLLITLLKILANMHSDKSDQPTDQDLLSRTLRSLASHMGEHGANNPSGVSQGCQDLQHGSTSTLFLNKQSSSKAFVSQLRQPEECTPGTISAEVRDGSAKQIKMNNFDLNDIYVDSDGSTEGIDRSPVPKKSATTSHDYRSWIQESSHHASPPQRSERSDSASADSPSSSSGDVQSCTDRIVFKLFGKEPTDFPALLRAQILDWLSHSPTDMESYIRPGCIILTIYLHQSEAAWEELSNDLGFSLSRLLDLSNDTFWMSGWIYIRVRHHIAFAYNGRVLLDKFLPRVNYYSRILGLKPIAVSASERVEFTIKGINLSQLATRLLCAVEGAYLVQEAVHELMDAGDGSKREGEIQCVTFSCSMPVVAGRGFVEIEDKFYSNFLPFIVADEDVCSEIRSLESALELPETDADVREIVKSEPGSQATDFINEIGWLLHRNNVRSRLGNKDPNTDLFPLVRFKWLIEFSVDCEWCSVVKKLLNVMLEGTVDPGGHNSTELALTEMSLLHRAVRKNCRTLVQFLLRYKPEKSCHLDGDGQHFLFRPDAPGRAGLTPLHIAAGKDGSEDVLDALMEDPGRVGIEAWTSSRDSTGFTPADYARLRGHYSYNHLVQRKINKNPLMAEHAVVDIPATTSSCTLNNKQSSGSTSSFQIGETQWKSNPSHCKLCDYKLTYKTASRSPAYRPAVLSMVAVAAVCVCVALLFKSSPEVLYMFHPFRWEVLECGTN